ncbi:MAG: hypothetical protein A2126_03430 [Candidatus Woykebacteria bacterium GWB1_45_5]|uniref:Uncharacterized protein n=2 Tax=Candidatus Woykeibacteriota TaxID=1817899 RepID=A0A1G1W4F1_9BACT|nr:MAG: hypothetical protein A2113_03195 [Candidatus Woykebacteria bacterium GWA1_44_8]OGY24475.1 MAG: hypothetical protein A2126_03430 [Candidatus Woykebacteria bacterium GWB1_45_5]
MNPSFIPVPPRFSRLLNRRKSRRFKLKLVSGLITFIFISFVVFLVGVTIAFGFFARNLPSPNKLSEKNFEQSTKIYDRNGVLLYNVFGEQNRTLVTLDKIPKDLKNATVAIEDKNFYKHKGFDVSGYLRASKQIVFEHKLTGGSTLTQQLVKNALLSPERTVTRKIKEFILAVQIERRYSKDEILQIYLNEIPYGGTAWGTEAAANQYFAKHVWELNLVESAILAGLPQKPTVYSPFGADPEAYKERTKNVLRRMREDGYITKEQEKKAGAELPNVKFASFGQNILAPHFSIYVKNKLEEKYGARLVQEGGLNVTTTLDIKLQEMAQEVVSAQVEKEKNIHVGNGAAIIQNSKTGEMLAWVGSKDYFAQDIPGQYDVVSQALRQPGSALKPFVYLTGFKKGYTPATMLLDISTDFGNYRPTNYSGDFFGPVPVRQAIGSSLNIPAVKMLAVAGLDDTIGTLKDFGITTLNDPSKYGLALTLGGGAIKLIELTNAYSILGNGGKYISPVVILKVTDPKGRVLEEFKPPAKQKQVATPEHVYLMQNILSDKAAKAAFGIWANRLNFRPDIASKTGTSERFIDNWAFGTSPSYTVGVWVGNNDNSPMGPRFASGVTGAAPIFYDLGRRLFEGKKVEEWYRPAGVVNAAVDSLSGMKPGKYSGSAREEVFTKWQAPTQEDDMHKEVKICKPTGLLANPSCEAAGLAETQVYLVMYDPYTKQFQPSFKLCKPSCPPTETDSNVYTPLPTSLSVVITSPGDDATVSTSFTLKAKLAGPNQLTAVEFYLNGVLKETLTFPPSDVSHTFSGVAPSPTKYTVMVKVYDSAGDSKTASIKVKVTAGSPMILSPP